MSKEKIEYAELRSSIITGCDVYLSARKKGEYLEGSYHGKQGLIRASKSKDYASKIVNDSTKDHSLLLALLFAIFNSSSKGLAMCIASQLIQGEKEIMGAYANDHLPSPIVTADSLKSSVFSKNIVETAACNNLIEIEDSPFGPVLGIDKKRCVRWILNREAPSSTLFKHLTNQFKADLDDTKSSEIDVTILGN